jgi:hypothetical protein
LLVLVLVLGPGAGATITGLLALSWVLPPDGRRRSLSAVHEQYAAKDIRQRRRELWADKLVFWGGQTWDLCSSSSSSGSSKGGGRKRLPNPVALRWHSFWRSGVWRADAWYHLCNHHVQLSGLLGRADPLGPYGGKTAHLVCTTYVSVHGRRRYTA